jgi:hypothetical protein
VPFNERRDLVRVLTAFREEILKAAEEEARERSGK